MKSGRSSKYFQSRKEKTNPMTSAADVQSSNDNKIDQDMRGYGAEHAKEEVVNPKTATQKKTAAVDTKDGEKVITEDEKKSAYIKKETSGDDV